MESSAPSKCHSTTLPKENNHAGGKRRKNMLYLNLEVVYTSLVLRLRGGGFPTIKFNSIE